MGTAAESCTWWGRPLQGQCQCLAVDSLHFWFELVPIALASWSFVECNLGAVAEHRVAALFAPKFCLQSKMRGSASSGPIIAGATGSTS